MRLTTVLLIASLLQVSATTLAQKITLSKSNAPLKTVLKEMRQQSGYIFLYSESLIKSAKPVSIKVKNIDFKEALKQVFENKVMMALRPVKCKMMVYSFGVLKPPVVLMHVMICGSGEPYTFSLSVKC